MSITHEADHPDKTFLRRFTPQERSRIVLLATFAAKDGRATPEEIIARLRERAARDFPRLAQELEHPDEDLDRFIVWVRGWAALPLADRRRICEARGAKYRAEFKRQERSTR